MMMDLSNRRKLSSGSTLINLACSGNPNYAILDGSYYLFVGESSSGKTFISMTVLAEASINKVFDDYDFIFDNAEDGALMDIEKYFGPKLAKRLQPPSYDEDKEPIYSRTAEGFYFNLDDRLQAVKKKKAKKFIWLLDSMDALDTDYAEKKFQEKKKATRKGTTAAGEYGDGKAKINSTYMRRVVADLRETDSILIILVQSRDNIDAGMFGPPETHAGGRALKFYSLFQLWSNIGSKIKKEVDEKNYQTGINAKISVKKNRLTGKEWTVQVPIYWSHGIDDVGSCVDYILEHNHWSVKSGVIDATEFGFVGKRALLIEKIEEEGLEFDLRDIVAECWKKIEDACVVHRKNKYAEVE